MECSKIIHKLSKNVLVCQTKGELFIVKKRGNSLKKDCGFNFEKEVQILKTIKHLNVVKMLDYDKNYFILEYIVGSTLYDIVLKKLYPKEIESFACDLFYQIVKGIIYCHKNGVIHRDLKLENLMYDFKNQRIVIIDFDLSATVSYCCKKLKRNCGSLHYASPQIVFNEVYKGCATDCWSIGICLFAFISGEFPFSLQEEQDLTTFFRKSSITFDAPQHKNIFSEKLKDLIQQMTIECEKTRIHFQEVIFHPWFGEKLNEENYQFS